jgi:hypothetical protein
LGVGGAPRGCFVSSRLDDSAETSYHRLDTQARRAYLSLIQVGDFVSFTKVAFATSGIFTGNRMTFHSFRVGVVPSGL